MSSDAADDGFEAFEVERVGYDADDVDFRAPSKPKCVALGIGGGFLAALVVACIVGTVATTWCVTSGPCGPAAATTTRSEAAAPSSVIASDMVAEFQADSAASSSRRRLVASSEVTLASGTTVDAQDIAAAGAALSADKTTYAAAIPAFVKGIVARLKTGKSYMLLSAQDRAEIFKVTARTMVREAVTKELAPARAYFAELEATHTTAAGVVWGSEEKKVLAPLIKSANVPHYRVDFAALVASKRRRLVATAPTTDEIKAMLAATNAAQVRCATYAGAPLLALTGCECRWPWQAQQLHTRHGGPALDHSTHSATPPTVRLTPPLRSPATTCAHKRPTNSLSQPKTQSFAEIVHNTSTTLAGSDAGFNSAADWLVCVDKMSSGMAAGFAPAAHDAGAQAKYAMYMDQHASDSGAKAAMVGMTALSWNTRVLGDSAALVTSFTTASTSFSKEAIKTAASPHFQCKPLVGAAGGTKCAPSLGAISAGATIAIGSCDPSVLPKSKLDEALAASAEAIVVEAASGVDKDGAALDVTKYAVEIAVSFCYVPLHLTRILLTV